MKIYAKKGQAAMEFLMTYGWAILVVLAAIGALAYFGILSPDNFLPGKCTLGEGFSCTEYKVDGTADTVQMRIRNNLGVDADSVNISIEGKGANAGCTFADQGFLNVENGDDVNATLLNFPCPEGFTGSKFSGDVEITYVRAGQTVDHTARGSITSRVE